MSSGTASGSHSTLSIFVSHSHEDASFCLKVVADLRARLGEDAVWYDASGGQHGLQGGEAWWDKIVAEITARPYFLVVLSPNATASKWVSQEMGIAFRQHVEVGKRLLPLRLAEAERRADWAGIQEFNFVAPRPYEQALDELLRALNVDTEQRAAAISMSAPPTPQQALLARLIEEAHTAYGRERWSDTLDRTEALIVRGAMIPALWRERASAALALDEAPTALIAVEQALKADPDDVETLRLQARILSHEGQTQRAMEALTLANSLAPLDDAATRLPLLADLYETLVTQNRWRDALRRCDDALYLVPQDIEWQRRRDAAQAALAAPVDHADAPADAQAPSASPDSTFTDPTEFSDFFDALFGNRPASASTSTTDANPSASGKTGSLKGEDIEQPVEITLREAYSGAKRVYTINQPETCSACNGRGKIGARTCVTCGGTGVVERERRITVNIPAGVDTGVKVRVAGEGQSSPTGGPRGDLYLNVTVKPDSRFERRGDDLIMEAQAPLTTAILGGELPLTLIDGKRITLTIPPKTQNGQLFRITGKGMPKLNSEAQGNLLVRMLVTLPQQLDEQELQLFEELRRKDSTS